MKDRVVIAARGVGFTEINKDAVDSALTRAADKMQEQADWLQIYCAVISGRYGIYAVDVQDAQTALDLTDDYFKDFKDRWSDEH